MLYPLKFRPIFRDYIWGGRSLQSLFNKPVPPTGPVAESWEIVDRSDDVSVVANGRYAGKTLRWLMEMHADKILGKTPLLHHPAAPSSAPSPIPQLSHSPARFPLLVKWLDA